MASGLSGGGDAVSSDDVRVGDYVSSRMGEGYVVAALPTGQYAISMNRRAKEGTRVGQDEITRVMRKGAGRWLPVVLRSWEERRAAGLSSVVCRLAAEALVSASGTGPGGSVGAPEARGGASGRGEAERVVERHLEGVGSRGVTMWWTLDAAGRAEAERLVEADARGMPRGLGVSGAVRFSGAAQSGKAWEVQGLMPWKAGRGGLTWDDAREILDEEGLT